MLDLRSIAAFIAALPATPSAIEQFAGVRIRFAAAIVPAAASLAQRGYLGCLPFAHRRADEYVLRLLPGQRLDQAPVAIALWDVTECLTIAPSLPYALAGALA